MAKNKTMMYGRCRILKEWPAWDYSVHEDPAQIERQSKAMNYPFDFELESEKETARFSSTSDLPYYETSLSGCACYDFSARNLPCKHIYRLAHELGIIEIVKRKSGYKVGALKTQREEVLALGEAVDSHPEQVKRIEKAMDNKCKPISVNVPEQTAIFSGSGKNPYETSLNSCTCKDFFSRRLPCKHIYRLRIELGLMEGNSDGENQKAEGHI